MNERPTFIDELAPGHQIGQDENNVRLVCVRPDPTRKQLDAMFKASSAIGFSDEVMREIYWAALKAASE